ncbi:ABC transporter permease, partial [Rhizobium ruizarguesonis]
MTIEANDPAIAIVEKPTSLRPVLEWIARRAEPVVIGLAAILIGLALFSLFILAVGKSPATLFQLMYTGGFGSWFSVQNSLSRAAPLLLTALCVALPARL